MSETIPPPIDIRRRRRVRARLAALSLLGAAMVALPMGLVLRYHDAELHSLAARRASLEPMARAVDVQRSLLVHRDIAAALLRGQAALEAERRVRQGEVDDRLTALALTLVAGPWERAVRESDALRTDWSRLARRLMTQPGPSAETSDQAHRLLVEQTLQVVDLLELALAPRAGSDTALASAWQTLLSLPREAARSGDPQAAGAKPGAGWRARLAGFDAALHATRLALDDTQRTLEQTHRRLLAAMAALAAAWLLFASPLWRNAGLRAASDAPQPPRPTGASSQRDEAERLLSRLRGSEDPTPSRYGDIHRS